MKRITTFKKPDLDALIATWLADRFLSRGEPCEIVFVAGGCHPKQRAEFDWIVEADVHNVFEFGCGRKHKPFAERYATSATGHGWARMLNMGRPVAHLLDLVDAIHARGRPYRDVARRLLHAKLHRIFNKMKSQHPDDLALYRATATWLDRYEASLGLGAVQTLDWNRVAHNFPKVPTSPTPTSVVAISLIGRGRQRRKLKRSGRPTCTKRFRGILVLALPRSREMPS